MNARELDTLVRIERPVADDALDGAGSGSWVLVDEVWAGLKDILPSRAEKVADGVNIATHPTRLRIRARSDVETGFRFVDGTRIMQIVAGPAELGRDFQEFMVEDYSSAGNGA